MDAQTRHPPLAPMTVGPLCPCLEQALADAQAGAERQRRRMLKSAALVGATCCAVALPALDGLTFDILLLDECSQMVEPLSLVPVARSRCRWLLLRRGVFRHKEQHTCWRLEERVAGNKVEKERSVT